MKTEVTVENREPVVWVSWGGVSPKFTVQEAVVLRNQLEDALEGLGRGHLGAYKEEIRLLRHELREADKKLRPAPGVFEVGDLVECVEPTTYFQQGLPLGARGRVARLIPGRYVGAGFAAVDGIPGEWYATRFQKVVD